MPRMAVYCIDTEALEGDKMEYCDFIAAKISSTLEVTRRSGEFGQLLAVVGRPRLDLHPTEGWVQSSTKTIEVTDKNGQKYKVTVEAVEE